MASSSGQLDLFRQIWKARPHKSEVSGKTLLPPTHEQWHWQFAHILPKGRYPKLKLVACNILLVLPDEHTLYDHQTHRIYDRDTGKAITPEWQRVFDRRAELKTLIYEGVDPGSIVLPRLSL